MAEITRKMLEVMVGEMSESATSHALDFCGTEQKRALAALCLEALDRLEALESGLALIAVWAEAMGMKGGDAVKSARALLDRVGRRQNG
jgi:hypothetical protein